MLLVFEDNALPTPQLIKHLFPEKRGQQGDLKNLCLVKAKENQNVSSFHDKIQL